MTSTDTTLAELAVRTPGASRVLKRYGLDFCCKGARPLSEACRARNIDENAVVRDIEREARETPVTSRIENQPNSEIVDFIVQRYHVPLRAELPELVRMAERVERRHAEHEACPRGLAAHLARMEHELIDHMAKEEGVLFPLLSAGVTPPSPIEVMRHEHDEHGAALAKMRELAASFDPPAGACATWRSLYLRLAELESELMDHIHLENNVLFARPGRQS
jgi:regulator of cell morphogenesis and NO signaling